MMINKRKKGRQFEFYIRDYLRDNGYEVYICGKSAVKIGNKILFKGNDIFGCIDILACRPGEKIKFIQATCDGNISKKEKDLSMVTKWAFEHSDIEVWQRKDKRRIVVFRLNKEMKLEKYAEIVNRKLFVAVEKL